MLLDSPVPEGVVDEIGLEDVIGAGGGDHGLGGGVAVVLLVGEGIGGKEAVGTADGAAGGFELAVGVGIGGGLEAAGGVIGGRLKASGGVIGLVCRGVGLDASGTDAELAGAGVDARPGLNVFTGGVGTAGLKLLTGAGGVGGVAGEPNVE